MAAARLVEELSARALGRYSICVIGEEPALAYNRVLLSSLLAREVDAPDLELKPAAWWRAKGVTLIYGRRAHSIDTKDRKVWLADGAPLPYAKLVLATGSTPVRLPLPGAGLAGVLTFRDRADVAAMLSRTGQKARAVVIGGGLLGLEAAHGLAKAGAKVTIIHLMDRLMERQLDARSAGMLKAALEARGMEVLLETKTAAIHGRGKVGGVRLGDGRVLDADMVVMAVGIRPNANLARAAKLAVNRGVVVDDHMETSEAGVFALGECAEHRGVCYGLVEPAYGQARVLAERLSGGGARYEGSLLATNLKVSGISVFSAGDFMGTPGAEPILLADPERGAYRKLVVSGDRLAGAVLFGDTADALWYLDLIRSGRSIAAMRDGLVFGRAFVEPVSEESPAHLQAVAA